MMATQDNQRRRELAAIHLAAKDLALPEDSYRALVSRFTSGRSESAGAMETRERRALLDHFRSLGFKPKPKTARKRPDQGSSRKADLRPQAGKLRALWYALWQLGEVESYGEEAMAGFLKRQTGLDALQFADAQALNLAIESLKGWCERVKYEVKPFHAEIPTPQEGSYNPGLIEAQWQRLIDIKAFTFGIHARLDGWLKTEGFYVSAPQFLDHEQATTAINKLGAWIRRVKKIQGNKGGGEGDGDAS